MSKQKAPNIPNAPQLQQNPLVDQTQNQLYGIANQLTSLDFSGQLSGLADTISLDPEATRLALQYAQSALSPAYQDSIRNIRNEAANAGALESSTFTDAIAQQAGNLNSQYQSATIGAALDDRTRALQNRLSLFGAGTDLMGNVNKMALGSEELRNSQSMQNYENVLAQWQGSQKSKNGGLLGGLMGAGGGALMGLALAPMTGGSSLLLAGLGGTAGGMLGGFGTQTTGSEILGAGAGLLGQSQGSSTPSYMPRSSAFSLRNPLGGQQTNNRLYDQLNILG